MHCASCSLSCKVMAMGFGLLLLVVGLILMAIWACKDS